MRRERDTLVFGLVMPPPTGFIERAVASGLAVVEAEEQLVSVEAERAAINDNTAAIPPDRPTLPGNSSPPCGARRKRRDSGVIDLLGLHGDAPSSTRSG